jgi:hypothetical protein
MKDAKTVLSNLWTGNKLVQITVHKPVTTTQLTQGGTLEQATFRVTWSGFSSAPATTSVYARYVKTWAFSVPASLRKVAV